MANRGRTIIGITVSATERAEFTAFAASQGKTAPTMVRQILRDATGMAFPVSNYGGLSPETIAERWLAKNTKPEVRAALLKALANGHS